MIKIEFIPKYRLYKKAFPEPVSVSSSIPEWWKHQESYLNNDQNVHNGTMMLTIKKCQSIFDSFKRANGQVSHPRLFSRRNY